MTLQTGTEMFPALPAPLEQVELEMALDIQDIGTLGFATALEQASLSIGGQLLFDLPCPGGENCQRVADIKAGDEVLLALLGCDGRTVTISAATGSGQDVFARFALSHAAVLGKLAGLESIAESPATDA